MLRTFFLIFFLIHWPTDTNAKPFGIIESNSSQHIQEYDTKGRNGKVRDCHFFSPTHISLSNRNSHRLSEMHWQFVPVGHFEALVRWLLVLVLRMRATLQRTSMQKKSCPTSIHSMISPAMVCRMHCPTSFVIFGIAPKSLFHFSYSNDVICNWNSMNRCAVVAGVIATLIHDAISNPTEVIKQRLQMYNSPYRTVLGCAVGVYRAEGIRAFYRSYVTQLCMNLPHQTIHFSTYEFFQNKVNEWQPCNFCCCVQWHSKSLT